MVEQMMYGFQAMALFGIKPHKIPNGQAAKIFSQPFLMTKYGYSEAWMQIGNGETDGQMHAGHFPELLNVRRRAESRMPRLLRLREMYSQLDYRAPERFGRELIP